MTMGCCSHPHPISCHRALSMRSQDFICTRRGSEEDLLRSISYSLFAIKSLAADSFRSLHGWAQRPGASEVLFVDGMRVLLVDCNAVHKRL